MFAIVRRKGWQIGAGVLAFVLAMVGAITIVAVVWLNPWLTRYVESDRFLREHDGYMWTTVPLSGTIDDPQQDLIPRIMEVIKESPGAALGLVFRQFGEWLKHAFGGE